jgi:FKBP-type peptidyl-prolyl cis-trans isomerase
MRLTTKYPIALSTLLLMITLLHTGCGRKPDSTTHDGAASVAFKPYTIQDSSKIITYPDGLQIYVSKAGPGDYPANGTHVRMHYYGVLDDGTVFDESFSRDEPLQFNVGSNTMIDGIELAVRKLRLGSQAIVIVPPTLGYGDGKGKHPLPPKIPANARLTFHIDLIGSF